MTLPTVSTLFHSIDFLPSHQNASYQSCPSAHQWSYDLLNKEEQRLFRLLSVFKGGCTLEAAAAVSEADRETKGPMKVLEGVASLLDMSLLQQTEREGDEPRPLMLATIREFGLERLRACGELEAASHRHSVYYLQLAEEAEPNLTGGEQRGWLDRLEQEHENLLTALEWLMKRAQTEVDQTELALRMFGALNRFWEVRGHWSEERLLEERALAVSEGVISLPRAKVLMVAGYFAYIDGNKDRAELLLLESLALYRELDNTPGIVDSLNILGGVARERGSFAAARALYEESLELSKEIGNKATISENLMGLGILLKDQGGVYQSLR